MITRRHRLPALSTVTIFVALAAGPLGAWAQETEVDFAREVLPILSNKCFVCHGPDTKKAKQLRLDSYAGATSDRGGYHAIDPEKPADSEIIVRLHDPDDPMPPEDAERQLTEEERDVLTHWAKQGGKYAVHWSFVPPIKATAPEGTEGSEAIDAWIAEGHKKAETDFAPEADRRTLARRAALILTGLPPEPDRLDRFLADKRPDAYEQLVNELMANARYGEHQARYWLDAVRYGDTHGLHLDNKRAIFPYRDWVVRALNQNMPLNQFITWQLAGDLLPDPTVDQQIATGFVRMNPSTAEGGAIPAEFQMKNNFDRVETLSTVLLGMTMTCARCHTHKYDPIPQTEYYQLLAFFNSTAEGPMDGNKYEYGPVLKVPADQAAWDELEKWEKERDRLLTKHLNLEGSKMDQLKIIADLDNSLADKSSQPVAKELVERHAKLTTAWTPTLVAKDLPKPRETKLLDRGEYDKPIGDPLQPDVISVMGSLPANAPRNRLGLAQWLTAREHPLTARVLVNRIWQRVFGYGLVRTPEDFGLQGEQPTHPELLDWLAVELQDSGWDLQHMLRLMVTSRTFKQDSARRPGAGDPENRLLARGPGHRLDAEVIRDMGLWASELLNPYRGGEGIKPYQPSGLWKALMHPGSNTKDYKRDKGDKLYRRSLYVYWKRTSPHPMMILFDAPDRESSCVRRSRTNTSLQSLALLNETQRIEIARKLAERLVKSGKDDKARLDLLYALLASRLPDDHERRICEDLLKAMQERYFADKDSAIALLSTGEAKRDETLDPADLAAWTQVASTILASDAAILLY